MSYKLVETANGAHALFDEETGETMHPNGPAFEAQQVYIGPSRLRERPGAVVFDVGLGAGTNAIAALRAGAGRVISFENTLGPIEFALAHADAFGFDDEATGEIGRMLAGTHAKWELHLGELPGTLTGEADIVFWDMYSPRSQPELWTTETFRKLRTLCRPGSTVHTFSAATGTRSALLEAGFMVGFGPATGVKQKRSTIAAHSLDLLAEPLPRDWLMALREHQRGTLVDHPQFA